MATDSILSFVTASILLGLAPGPDNLFVLTQSALHGKKAGFLVTLGLCTGLLFHTSLVAFGIALVFQASWALNALKLFGASYLLFLAYKTLTTKTTAAVTLTNPVSAISLYKRGIIMNISNPKVSLLFLAFLPQFISNNSETFILQAFALGFVFIAVTFCVFGSIAFTGNALKLKFETSSHLQLLLNRIAGAVFIILALNLAI